MACLQYAKVYCDGVDSYKANITLVDASGIPEVYLDLPVLVTSCSPFCGTVNILAGNACPGGAIISLTQDPTADVCIGSSTTYDCIEGVCTPNTNGTGVYNTLSECQAADCADQVTYDCTDGICTPNHDGTGTYSTLAECEDDDCLPPVSPTIERTDIGPGNSEEAPHVLDYGTVSVPDDSTLIIWIATSIPGAALTVTLGAISVPVYGFTSSVAPYLYIAIYTNTLGYEIFENLTVTGSATEAGWYGTSAFTINATYQSFNGQNISEGSGGSPTITMSSSTDIDNVIVLAGFGMAASGGVTDFGTWSDSFLDGETVVSQELPDPSYVLKEGYRIVSSTAIYETTLTGAICDTWTARILNFGNL